MAAPYNCPHLGVIMGVAALLYASFLNCMLSIDGVTKFLSDSSTMEKFQTPSRFSCVSGGENVLSSALIKLYETWSLMEDLCVDADSLTTS